MDPVADDRSNAKAAHLTCRVGDDPILIVEHHPKPPVRENLVNHTFDRKQFFFRHRQSILVRRVAHQRAARG